MAIWKGNDLPLFKNNEENLRKLDELVDRCSVYQYPDVGFDKVLIRKYIIEFYAQRRKRRAKGVDFEQVSNYQPT